MIKHNKVSFTEAEQQAVLGVLKSGRVINGEKCQELEQEWSILVGSEDAAMVSSGLSALMLALKPLGHTRATIPAYSCVCLQNATWNAGADFILADINNSLTIVNNPPFSEAIFAVHTFGSHANIKSLKKLDAFIIEDMSHGVFKQEADLAIASFGPTKFVSSTGGGIVSGSKELITKVKDFRDYGDKEPSTRQNNLPSDISAAIVLEKLKRLDEIQETRLGLASDYDALLNYIPNAISFPYRYCIRVPNAQQVSEQMKAQGVQAELPVWQYQDNFPGLPETEKAFEEVLSLPFHKHITYEEQKEVVRVLSSACGY